MVFHLSVGVYSGCPDPWEYSLHDYYLLSEGWTKYPPPHLVAGAFVKSNDKASPRSSSSSPAPAHAFDKESAYRSTLAQLRGDGNLKQGLIHTKPDAKQRRLLDFTRQVVDKLNSGASLQDIEV